MAAIGNLTVQVGDSLSFFDEAVAISEAIIGREPPKEVIQRIIDEAEHIWEREQFNSSVLDPLPTAIKREDEHVVSLLAMLANAVGNRMNMEAILGDLEERLRDEYPRNPRSAQWRFKLQLLVSIAPFAWVWLKEVSGWDALRKLVRGVIG